MDAHLPDLEKSLVEAAILRFYGLRKVEGLRKKPSTSELLDWLFVLARAGANPEDIAGKLPYLGILIKQEKDLDLLSSRKRQPPLIQPKGSRAMFDLLLVNLRSQGLKVGLGEWLTFLDGLNQGLVVDLEGLYGFGRAVLCHSETQFDAWDLSFKATFAGVELPPIIKDRLAEWPAAAHRFTKVMPRGRVAGRGGQGRGRARAHRHGRRAAHGGAEKAPG